ncbi:MAG TPA: hypothetical protein VH442_13445, partial [Micromonosporaceae bacterium]
MTDPHLAAAESAYLEARSARDRASIAEARGEPTDDLVARAEDLASRAHAALLAVVPEPTWPADDQRAYQTMSTWYDAVDTKPEPPVLGESWAVTAERGLDALCARITSEYARAQSEVDVGDVTLTRLHVLERLGLEPEPARRRRLFYALESMWQVVDSDGGVASPYQRMLPLSADRWARLGSPVDRNAAALGIAPGDVEAQLVAILEGWRDAASDTIVEPWDWWYAGGAASRSLRTATHVGRLRAVSDAYHASLGADPAALDVGFDI